MQFLCLFCAGYIKSYMIHIFNIISYFLTDTACRLSFLNHHLHQLKNDYIFQKTKRKKSLIHCHSYITIIECHLGSKVVKYIHILRTQPQKITKRVSFSFNLHAVLYLHHLYRDSTRLLTMYTYPSVVTQTLNDIGPLSTLNRFNNSGFCGTPSSI
jgi:hypothetical protein